MKSEKISTFFKGLMWALGVALIGFFLSYLINFNPNKPKRFEPIEIVFTLFFAYLTFDIVRDYSSEKIKKIDKTFLRKIQSDIEAIEKRHKEILYNANDINLIFAKFNKFSHTILNEVLKHSWDKANDKIYFHNMDEYKYSDLLTKFAGITNKSYSAIMNKEATPDWFFIDDDKKGSKQNFLKITNNLGKKLITEVETNETNGQKSPFKKINAKRILVFTKQQLINSFQKDILNEENFKTFIKWHSNIELIWINPDEFNNLLLPKGVKEILVSSDFALFDNNIVLHYEEKELDLLSNIDLYKQIFEDDCSLFQEIMKKKADIMDLYTKTKKEEIHT